MSMAPETREPSAAELWQVVYAAFAEHARQARDASPQAALDRIAHKVLIKVFGTVRARSFNPEKCDIRREIVSLHALEPPYRADASKAPQRDQEPIVVLACQGKLVIVDGNKRVAHWLRSGSSAERQAIVIEPAREGPSSK